MLNLLYWFAWFLGEWDDLMLTLVMFVLVGYVIIFCCAIIEKKLSSETIIHESIKKFVLFLIVGLANIVDVYVIGECGPLRSIVIIYFTGKEGLSLLKNGKRIGLQIPQKLIDVLSKLHKWWI